MEDNNNINNTAPVLEEIKELNQGINLSNQKLDSINEFLIIQEKNEAEKEQNEMQRESEEIESSEEEAETIQSILYDIRMNQETISNQLELTNELLGVTGIYIGIVIGLLFMKSLFDRLFK